MRIHHKKSFIYYRLSTILKRPNTDTVQASYEKTLALKIMSLDFNTTESTFYSDKKRSNTVKRDEKLPSIKK